MRRDYCTALVYNVLEAKVRMPPQPPHLPSQLEQQPFLYFTGFWQSLSSENPCFMAMGIGQNLVQCLRWKVHTNWDRSALEVSWHYLHRFPSLLPRSLWLKIQLSQKIFINSLSWSFLSYLSLMINACTPFLLCKYGALSLSLFSLFIFYSVLEKKNINSLQKVVEKNIDSRKS